MMGGVLTTYGYVFLTSKAAANAYDKDADV
jgi:hypothetical protein